MEKVILVDEHDNSIGSMEKMEAHRKGLLHRAFSILIFNSRGDMLIQKRASSKYHSGGLWTNACCSHPVDGEPVSETARKRLNHEMGIYVQLDFAYKFIYKTALDHDLIEHELDYVFTGMCNGDPAVNPDEVEDWKYIDMDSLRHDISLYPEHYTYWFKAIINHQELASHLGPN
jgi:isopentenyl-diphosphate Delta-isomerase